MTDGGSRRFTDEEVALVLRKAAQIDSDRGTGGATGLTHSDLQEIAREVGISGSALDEAVTDLRSRPTPGHRLKGAPLNRSALHTIDGRLNEEALSRLMSVVDNTAESTGVVSEALGSVRWTASDRFKSTQVSITPGSGETTIQVVEKAIARVRNAITLVPAAWGTIFAGALVSAGDASLGASALIGGLGAALGLAAGRTAWGVLSRSSAARVEKLAADLAREARTAAKAGLLEDDPSSRTPDSIPDVGES